MKKILLFAGLMTAAAISLTNCKPAEINIEPVRTIGHTYHFTASTVDTKTTNSGMSTLWQAYDSLTVIYASAGADNYVAGEAFVDAASDGSRVASFSLEAAPTSAQALDWYVLFPYMNRKVSGDYMTVKTPAAKTDGDGWMYVGHSNGAKQDAYNSTAHLSKSLCPMYGIARNVSGDEVGFTMKHLTSVIEFNVVNNSGSTLKVKSVTLSATEDVVGSYFIDITGETPVFTPSGENYVYNNAEVYIENPGELAASQTAKFYLPIKPYTHDISSTFDVTVVAEGNGSMMTASFNLSPAGAQAVFSPGKIKKVTLNLTSSNLVEKSDAIADAHNASSGAQVVFKDVLVAGVMKQGFFITDNTDIFYVYLKGAPSVTKGQKVKVKGQISKYQGNKQITNDPAPEVTESGNGSVTIKPVAYTGSEVEAAYVDNNARYVTVEATGLTTTTLSVAGTEKILYIATNNRADGVTIAKNKQYVITGYVYGHGKSSGKEQVYVYAESAEEIGGGTVTESISVSPNSLSFEKEGGSKEVTVTSDNENWTVDASTVPEWLTCTKSGSKITFSAAANEGTKRSATVKLNHSNGTLSTSVKVSQDGATASSNLSLSVTKLSFTATETDVKHVSVICDNTDWTWAAEGGDGWLTVEKVINLDGESPVHGLNISVSQNTGAVREATVTVTHSNGELSSTLQVTQTAAPSGGSKTYVKITSTSALTAGDYLIVCEEAGYVMNGGNTNLDSAGGLTGIISNGSVTTAEDCYFTYNPTDGSFLSASGKYFGCKPLKSGAEQNGLDTFDEFGAERCAMTVSFDSDGNAHIVSPLGPVMRFNSNKDQLRFRFFKSSTYTAQKAVQLYKKQ